MEGPRAAGPEPKPPRYVRAQLAAAAIFGALVAVGLLAWQLAHFLLVLFAAILLAVLLDALAFFVRSRLKLGRTPALLVVVTLLVAATAGFVWLAGPRVTEQAGVLFERVPQAVDELEAAIRARPWAAQVLDAIPSAGQLLPSPAAIVETIPGVFSTALGAVLNATIVVIIGFYLALDPRAYRSSVLALLPARRQAEGESVLDALGHALRWWLVGRLASMLAVGVLTILGLWLIDMPLVLALGVLAGLLSFVPYVGPILSSVPAVLIGFVDGPLVAVWVIAVYAGVQFLEGNFITPVIQKRAVSLPPAALLSAQLLMGVLFGFIGVVLATPLAVVVIVIVQIVYVRDLLGHPVRVLGEHGRAGSSARSRGPSGAESRAPPHESAYTEHGARRNRSRRCTESGMKRESTQRAGGARQVPLERLQAVLFDMDGVVTDTAEAHAAAWKRLFDEYLQARAESRGGEFRPFDADAEYREYVDGKPRYEGVKSFLASRGIDLPYGDERDGPEKETVCGLGNRKNAYFREWLSQHAVETFPGTLALLEALRSRGIKTAVFSASRNADAVLASAGVQELFDAKVDGADGAALGLPGKPDPAMLHEAAARLGVEPGRAAVMEDSTAGVAAGAAGGFRLVVGVDRAGHADSLLEHGADAVVSDARELLPAAGRADEA